MFIGWVVRLLKGVIFKFLRIEKIYWKMRINYKNRENFIILFYKVIIILFVLNVELLGILI